MDGSDREASASRLADTKQAGCKRRRWPEVTASRFKRGSRRGSGPGHRHQQTAFRELMSSGAVKRPGRGRP